MRLAGRGRAMRAGLGALGVAAAGLLLAMALPPLLQVAGHMLTVPLTRRLAAETLKLASLCTLVCLLLGCPLAWALRLGAERLRQRGGGARAGRAAFGLLGRATGLLVVLGEFGLVNLVLRTLRLESAVPRRAVLDSELAVLGGMVQVFAPFMVLALYRSMARIDIGTVRALRSLGLSHLRLFLLVALPQSLGGAAAGVATVFALATGAYVTVAMAGGRRVNALAGLAYDESATLIGWQVAAVAVVLAGLGLGVLARWLARSHDGDLQRPNSRPAAPRTSA